MTITKLIAEFSERVVVPVELDDVVASLVKRGVRDEIYYWKVDSDTDVLRGEITYWKYPDGEGGHKHCADIDYAKSLPIDWQRLVICKELLHILDPVESRVAAPDEVRELIQKIRLPPEDQEPLRDGMKVLSDRVGIYQALAVLFPWKTRELLGPPLADGKITIQDISLMLSVPLRYVAVVMSTLWPPAYDTLLNIE